MTLSGPNARRCELCDHGDRSLGHRAQAARPARTSAAHVGSPYGKDAAQDAHRLYDPLLPSRIVSAVHPTPTDYEIE
jgi:hypothetical protein